VTPSLRLFQLFEAFSDFFLWSRPRSISYLNMRPPTSPGELDGSVLTSAFVAGSLIFFPDLFSPNKALKPFPPFPSGFCLFF